MQLIFTTKEFIAIWKKDERSHTYASIPIHWLVKTPGAKAMVTLATCSTSTTGKQVCSFQIRSH